MAAVIKVKRRLDEDPAEALVVQLDDDDGNGGGCDKNTTLTFSNHPDCSSCYKRQRRGLDCDSSASDKAKPAVRFDYLTTFSERESNKTSSVRMTRRLKRLLQNPTNSDMRKAVVVKRRLQPSEDAKTYRLNSRVGKDSGIAVAQRRKTSFRDSESDSSSSAVRPKSKTKRTKKTYRLKRKFRQLVDADDIELINSNICAMSMSSKPDDKVSKPKNQFPSAAAKRWRANDTLNLNKDTEDDLLRELATGENLLYDAVAAAAATAANSEPVPIFLGELEDWDAVDESATTAVRDLESGNDVSKAGRLAKLAESEDSGSVTTTTSASTSTISTPDRPTQAVEFAANDKAEIVDDAKKVKRGEENGAETFNKVAAVANNNTCSSAEYVYDLYVRRLNESDIPAVHSGTASNYLPLNGVVVAGSCDGYCSEEVNVDGCHRSDRLHAGGQDQVREAEEDENEQNYGDERSYSTLANADDMAPRATISDDEEDEHEHAYADGERRRMTAQLDSAAATSSNRRVFSPTANELLCGESLLDDNDRRSNDDDDEDEQTDDDDFYADEHVQRHYENNLVDVISNDANAAASSSSRRAMMHANFVHNSGLNRFRRDWLALSTRNNAADDLQTERAHGNPRRPPNTHRRRRRGQFSERNRPNMTELANNADEEYFAHRERRSTLPNVVSGQTLVSAERREANAEENAVAQANSTVEWTRRRFSDAPMDHDADTSNLPSTSSAHMRPTTHPRNFMLRHQMRPIVQITNQRRTSMDNSDAEFYYENDDDFHYQVAGRSSLFPGGGLRHNNENFICLSRFAGGRSGRRNVMAPTPAPRADVVVETATPSSMGVGGTDHGGQRQNNNAGNNNEQRGNLRFFYDNDLDDDDIFAHMSNGEESPHPHSDDTEEDDEGGDDDGGLGASDAGDDVEYGFGSNEDSN